METLRSDIIFILPSQRLEGVNQATQTPSLGVAYLAAMLSRNNFLCKVIDMPILRIKDSEVLDIIGKEKPEVVGISANLFTGNSGITLSRQIKERFGNGINVIFGGPFPTSSPEKFLKEGNADAVVLGEGEETLVEIMKNFKEKSNGRFSEIPGLAYVENGRINVNPRKELNKDLDSLSFPAWGLFPKLSVYKTRSRKAPAVPLLTSRGCPFNCVYCSKDVFRSIFRPRSAENVIEEIDYLVKEFGIKQLDIMDDNFSLDRRRAEKILDLIIERNYDLAINLQLGVRADSVNEVLIKKMKKAGVYKIAFGVESGDEQVLKNIKKRLDLNQVLKSASLAKKAGMIVYGFFMFGLPGDDSQSMQKTIEFALKMDPHIANFVITIPFPGTRLYEMVKSSGRFVINTANGLDIGFYGNRIFYELGDLKEREILHYYKLSYRRFYGRLSKISEIIFSVRSISELKWVINTGFSLMKPMLRKESMKV